MERQTTFALARLEVFTIRIVFFVVVVLVPLRRIAPQLASATVLPILLVQSAVLVSEAIVFVGARFLLRASSLSHLSPSIHSKQTNKGIAMRRLKGMPTGVLLTSLFLFVRNLFSFQISFPFS